MYLEQTQTNMASHEESFANGIFSWWFRKEPSKWCLGSHLGRFQGGEKRESDSSLLLCGIFSKGIQQGNNGSFHGTPLRGAGRMTEGQMAFPVQSGYNEALRHQQVPSGRECSHTFFGLKKQCLTALNVSSWNIFLATKILEGWQTFYRAPENIVKLIILLQDTIHQQCHMPGTSWTVSHGHSHTARQAFLWASSPHQRWGQRG